MFVLLNHLCLNLFLKTWIVIWRKGIFNYNRIIGLYIYNVV